MSEFLVAPGQGERQDRQEDLDTMLDEALRLTFPASDPISLQFDRDRGSNGAKGDGERDFGHRQRHHRDRG